MQLHNTISAIRLFIFLFSFTYECTRSSYFSVSCVINNTFFFFPNLCVVFVIVFSSLLFFPLTIAQQRGHSHWRLYSHILILFFLFFFRSKVGKRQAGVKCQMGTVKKILSAVNNVRVKFEVI